MTEPFQQMTSYLSEPSRQMIPNDILICAVAVGGGDARGNVQVREAIKRDFKFYSGITLE